MKKKLFAFMLLATCYMLLAAAPAFAADPCPNNICKTALGDFDVTKPETIISRIFAVVLFIASFGAFILFLIAGYNLLTSSGNKEKVAAAREMITSTVLGLLFVILSIVILEIIGVDILRIPGLGR